MKLVHQYRDAVAGPDGKRYVARAYADAMRDGLWQAWFVFFPLDGDDPVATDRETTQSRERHVLEWAVGVSNVYLEGAIRRAYDRRPEARLARRAARAQMEEEAAEQELEAYRAAAAEALSQARAARAEREVVEETIRRTRSGSGA